MDYHDQPRVRPGVPTGGQWTTLGHADAGVSLSDAPGSGLYGGDVLGRLAALRRQGYVEPLAGRAGDDPRRSDGVGGWWFAHFYSAEYGAPGGDYPQMPDDYTPNRTGGLALSGRRRTHRMSYRTAGDRFALRMPSATSIKAFDRERGGTFDIPVSAVDADGRLVSGWVRVTRTGPRWTTTGLGSFGADTEAQVSEAVAAVLEARRPSTALRQVGDLLERHRVRLSAGGNSMVAVRSSFIGRAGYDEDTGTMAVDIRGKLYGYDVPRVAFAEMAVSNHPGKVYNRLIRGNRRVQVTRCGRCLRFFAAANRHTCPTGHGRRPGTRNGAARAVFGSS